MRWPRLLLDWAESLPAAFDMTGPAGIATLRGDNDHAMNAWLILLAAGLLEIVWATGLRFTDGFTRLLPTVAVLAIAWLSFYLLAVAMRDIPMGTAYAVWTGIGATGVAILGILWFKEPVSLARLGFIAMIVAGIIGLKWSTSNH